jgi:alkylation response protein AidB-like acyl-CoA dehydrogenase
MSAAYLAVPVTQEIFGNDPRAVLAWGPGPRVRAVECEGGYRVTGVWAFASGGRHATWLGAHCPIWQADGSPRLHADGRQIERTMLVPSSEVEWTDIWNVVGLRGTASDQFALTDHFVRGDHSMTRDWQRSAAGRPALPHVSDDLLRLGFSGVALGIARAHGQLRRRGQEQDPARQGEPIRDNAVVQTNLARSRSASARRLPAAVGGGDLEEGLGRRQAFGRPSHHHPHGLDQRHPSLARGGRLRL